MIASKNQIPRNKVTKGCQRPLQEKVQAIEERNERREQKMERPPMLIDW
jgi:hypothetical protein